MNAERIRVWKVVGMAMILISTMGVLYGVYALIQAVAR